MSTDPLSETTRILATATDEVRRAVLAWLRARHPIHPLETDWRVPAEVILEAISRSPDLSKRGVRGLIAEAYFDQMVGAGVHGWKKEPLAGNFAFDCLLRLDAHSARIQVKSQRRISGRPMTAREAARGLSPTKMVVETQKTRAGEDADGADTRPYRFGDFDILAVSVEPSTGDWKNFRYTLARWLLPRPNDRNLLQKFQPVSLADDGDWTGDIATALDWFVRGGEKTISM